MSTAIHTDTLEHGHDRRPKARLRLMTCGDSGGGKSTLIARLLDDAGTACLRFAAVELPSDEQHTRRMVEDAGGAEAALVVVDARRAVTTEVRRDIYLAALLGVRRVVLAVNKLDLVQYSREIFARIESECVAFAEKAALHGLVCLPLSALRGDNIAAPSRNTPWYRGPTLLQHLESLPAQDDVGDGPFRFLVEQAGQSDSSGRQLFGRVAGGAIRAGMRVRALPGGKDGVVRRVSAQGSDLEAGMTGQSVTLTLAEDLGAKSGDMLTAAGAPAEVADQFQADLIWLGEEPMLPGRPYLLTSGSRAVGASITKPKYKVNIDTLEHLAATSLELNEMGVCNLHLEEPIAFDPYKENRHTGGFVLLDRLTGKPIGVGMLHFALRRSQNIHWQAIEINKRAHAALKGQRPCVVWFTGLSGAGKSTIANLVEKRLHAQRRHTYLLDGDNVRHGLNKDLGFTEADRVENIRRVAEVAKLMVDAGLIVLVSFISPFRAERQLARNLVETSEFCEVFVDVPLRIAEQRDPKGLYRKARRGELKNFTGIDSPYEPPEAPDVRIDTTLTSPEDAAESIVAHLVTAGILPS